MSILASPTHKSHPLRRLPYSARFLIATLAAAALRLAGTAGAQAQGAKPGNSPNAKSCQKGGWQQLVTSSGRSFASEEECVAYAAPGGVLQPKLSGPTPLDLCKQQLADAGLTEPADANYIIGTEGDDTFTLTSDNDVVCGFGGDDQILAFGPDSDQTLGAGDIFLGGDGADFVDHLSGGTFNGGAGDDGVLNLDGGTFNGGDGKDNVNRRQRRGRTW